MRKNGTAFQPLKLSRMSIIEKQTQRDEELIFNLNQTTSYTEKDRKVLIIPKICPRISTRELVPLQET